MSWWGHHTIPYSPTELQSITSSNLMKLAQLTFWLQHKYLVLHFLLRQLLLIWIFYIVFSWAKEISLEVEWDWKLWRTGAVPASLSLQFPHNPGLWSLQRTRSVTTSSCLVRSAVFFYLILKKHQYNNISVGIGASTLSAVVFFSTVDLNPTPAFLKEVNPGTVTPTKALQVSPQVSHCSVLSSVFRRLERQERVRYQDMSRRPRKLWKLWKRRLRL